MASGVFQNIKKHNNKDTELGIAVAIDGGNIFSPNLFNIISFFAQTSQLRLAIHCGRGFVRNRNSLEELKLHIMHKLFEKPKSQK